MVEKGEHPETSTARERRRFEPPRLVLRGKLTPRLQGSGPPGPPNWDGKGTGAAGKPVP